MVYIAFRFDLRYGPGTVVALPNWSWADTANDRIQQFDSVGTFIRKWGTSGNQAGQLDRPTGVPVDQTGNVYVADSANSTIQITRNKPDNTNPLKTTSTCVNYTNQTQQKNNKDIIHI